MDTMKPREKAEALAPLFQVWQALDSGSDLLAGPLADVARAEALDGELLGARAQVDQDRSAMVDRLMTGPVPVAKVGQAAALFASFQTDGSALRMYVGAAAALRNRAYATARENAKAILAHVTEVATTARTEAAKLGLPAGVTTAEQATAAGVAARWDQVSRRAATLAAAQRVAAELRRLKMVRSVTDMAWQDRPATPPSYLTYRQPWKVNADFRLLPGPVRLLAEIAAEADPGIYAGADADRAWWVRCGWTAKQERDREMARKAGVSW